MFIGSGMGMGSLGGESFSRYTKYISLEEQFCIYKLFSAILKLNIFLSSLKYIKWIWPSTTITIVTIILNMLWINYIDWMSVFVSFTASVFDGFFFNLQAVTWDRSVVFSGYSGFLDHSTWSPRYNCIMLKVALNTIT